MLSKINAHVVKRILIIILISISIFSFGFVFIIMNPVFFVGKTDVVIKVDKEQMYKDVEYMTKIDPPRSYKNLESLNNVASYIEERFKGFDCELEVQKFTAKDHYAFGGVEDEYKNVICLFGPKDKERIVVGAHYDAHDNLPAADDNASAVAGLLELGRLINDRKDKLDYQIELVAYSLEELPFFKTEKMGSAIHAKSLKDDNVPVKLMLSLEMIGYFSEDDNSQKYPNGLMKSFYPNKGNFITVIGKLGQGGVVKKVKKQMKKADIKVWSMNAPRSIPGIDFSDHLNYWNHGYDAVMITDTAFYRNNNYHKASDTIDTLDFDKMSEVVRGVYYTILKI